MRGNPQTRHDRRHGSVDMDKCWKCHRDRTNCQSKIRFATYQEADEWVTEFNRTYGYARPMHRYPCIWCPGWHMTTAKTKVALRRVEEARRRDLHTATLGEQLDRDTSTGTVEQ